MKTKLFYFLFVLLLSPVSSRESYQTFDRVWTLVEEKFYDPTLNGWAGKDVRSEARTALVGVDDPEETARLINGFLARLNASHTRLFSNREPDYYELLDVFYFGAYEDEIRALFKGAPRYPGILIQESEGVIVDVVPGGPAEKAGLRKDDRIVQADGLPYHPLDSFAGKVGKPVRLQVSRGDGTVVIVVQPEEIYPRQAFLRSMEASARVIPGEPYDLGYVRMWSYAGEHYHEKLKEVLTGKLAQADGLLLDLRGRWGGAQPHYLELFAPTPRLKFTKQDGEVFETEGSLWNKPVGLIIDSTVSSGKEVIAYGFRKNKLGPVIGERTQGALLGGSLHLLPGGYALYLATVDVQLDGQRLEGLGVGPGYPEENPTAEVAGRYLQLEMFKMDVTWRADLDQSARFKNSPDTAKVDQQNTEWAKRVVEGLGWPGFSMVGEDHAYLFWLIVQHSPDYKFKEECLELMTRAVEEGEASARERAYLYDRVQMQNNKPQRYGTQLWSTGGQELKLWAVEDPANLDKRRESVGLGPISDYLKYFELDGKPLDEVMHKL